MSKYDDIIDHPHYQSAKRPHMTMLNRAAQFAPFAALTGYREMVEQTADSINENTDADLYQPDENEIRQESSF